MTSDKDLNALLEEAIQLREAENYSESIAKLEALELFSKEQEHLGLQIKAAQELTMIFIDFQEDIDKAIEYSAQYEILSLESGDKPNIMIAKYFYGMSLEKPGTRYGDALDKYEEAITLAKELGNKKIEIKVRGKSGDIYFIHAENYDKALADYLPFIELSRDLEDNNRLDAGLRMAELCYEKLGRNLEALASLDERLVLNEKLGNKDTISFCLVRKGYLLTKIFDKHNESLLCYEKAELVSREQNDVDNLKASLSSQAFLLYYKFDRFDEALIKYNEVEAICIQLGDEKSLLTALYNQARIYIEKKGDYENAYKKSVDLEALALKQGHKEFYVNSLENQITIHKSWGEKDKARQKKKELKAVK